MSIAFHPPTPETGTDRHSLGKRIRVSTWAKRGWIWAGLLLVLFAAVREHAYWGGRFYFDDAFMYVRYATNFRHGWGIAWNPGGPHTYGLTSLPWFFVILAGTFFTHNFSKLLTGASCLTGLLAMGALCVAISRRAGSPAGKRPLQLLPWIALPLLLNLRFSETWANGMETMLGMLALTLFLIAHASFEKRGNVWSAVTLALAAVFTTLTRPELLLVVGILPALAWVLNSGRRRPASLLTFYGITAALLATSLVACDRYFGTPVPLAFYLKAQHGYDGYSLVINPWTYATTFLVISLPATALLAALARRRHARMLAVFLIPLFVEVLYLATVTQIMGSQARYYIPLLPLLIVPAGLLVDDAVCNGMPPLTPLRALAVLLVLMSGRDYTRPLTQWVGERAAARETFYNKPVFLPRPSHTLPFIQAWADGARFASRLSPGTTMCASEVGMLGALAPEVRIIDMAGLNDAHLARHSTDVTYILSRQPDVIWFPNPDYTRLYGSLASSPDLLRDYDLYQEALGFGLAVRKASRHNPEFERSLGQAWQTIYPGFAMEDYRVTQIEWDPNTRVHGGKGNVLELLLKE